MRENSTGMVKYATSPCPTASTKALDITQNVAINRWHSAWVRQVFEVLKPCTITSCIIFDTHRPLTSRQSGFPYSRSLSQCHSELPHDLPALLFCNSVLPSIKFRFYLLLVIHCHLLHRSNTYPVFSLSQ